MKNFTFKVSVCVSVYNSENQLNKCLNSLSVQTLGEELEIILVDDGSTDSSYEIMSDFQRKHPKQVKLIRQENKGLAQGRQTGINSSSGEYLAFLDTDDYFLENALEKMYKTALLYNSDIVECITSKGGELVKSNYAGLRNSKNILSDYFEYGLVPPMLWLRIYRKELFEIPLLPIIHTNNEDVFAFPCLLYRADSIYFLDEQLHYYSIDNENSVMNKLKDKSKGSENLMNKLKTLQVPLHIQNYIGLQNIGEYYYSQFKYFQSRVILDFCLGNYNHISVNEIIKIAFEKSNTNMNDISSFLKNLKHYNKIIQLLINNIGLKATVHVYRQLNSLKVFFLKFFKS